LAVLLSPLTALSPALAVPAGVPNRRCGTLENPRPGTLCYTVTQGGGKVNAGQSPKDFSTTIQSTEREYVIADVVVEVTSSAGDRSGPTVNQISPGGTASVVSIATDKLRELKQIKADLQSKAKVLAGPALIEAQSKLSALSEQERNYEQVVTTTIAAGQDAGKFQVTGSARSRGCGWGNLDTCGSWVEYNIYVVKRYIGDPIAAYNRAFAVAQDARSTIDRLVVERPSSSQPSGQRPPSTPTSLKSQTISFKNNCPRPIQIAVHFLNPANQWQSKAWYTFAPNEGPARLDGIDTRNRYVYYYAETTDDSNLVWAGNLSQYVNDRLYNFQQIDTGPSVVRWTQTLSCPYAHRISSPNSATLVASLSPEVYLLTQATSKQPTANQLPPSEQPPIVPDAQQTQEDQPKVAPTQAGPVANPTNIPAKTGTDAAEPDPTEPPPDTPNPAPTNNPTNSPTNAIPESVPSPQNMSPTPGMPTTQESPTLNSPAPTPLPTPAASP